MDDEGAVPDWKEMTRSSRDPDELRRRLESWLAHRLPEGASPAVTDLAGTSATGMSSETLLFHATWDDRITEVRVEEDLVARVAPADTDVPVFPRYDLTGQFEVVRLVGELSDVPVPQVRWDEPDPAVLGSPFFVMDRVDGIVPPDVMPYPFGDNWLYDASRDDQRRLQDSTVAALAGIHGIDRAEDRFAFLDAGHPGDTALRRRFALTRHWYEWCVAGGRRSPLIDDGFAWLEQRFPSDEGPAVLSWGDSRIGNVLYRDFEPVAVLDWEMAAVAPREVDLAWLFYSHKAFQDLAGFFDLEGMPWFLRPDEVASSYEMLTGYTPRDLEWYGTYAALQWAIVFLRTNQRAVHFGDEQPAEDVDAPIRNGDALREMLAGNYWKDHI